MHPVLGLNRHRTFEPDDLELLSNLVPDLHIALRVQEHLGALRWPGPRRSRTSSHGGDAGTRSSSRSSVATSTSLVDTTVSSRSGSCDAK